LRFQATTLFLFWGDSEMPVKFVTDSMGEVEVNLKKAGNELVVPKPEIVMKVEGKPVQEVRVIADKRYLWRGKGVQLATETKLINPEDGKQVPSGEILEVLDRYNYKYIDELFNEIDKKQIEYYAVYPDGKEEPIRPFPRTDIIKIPEENWVSSTVLDQFEVEKCLRVVFYKGGGYPQTLRGGRETSKARSGGHSNIQLRRIRQLLHIPRSLR